MSDSDVIKVDSIDQSEKIILEHVNNGENYRDIAQITFEVNGTVKRFNPSQISKIKAKYEQNQAQNGHDADKSMVFKKFRDGKSIINVVIETGLNYEYVKKAYEEFLESEDKIPVPKWFYWEIMWLAGYPGYSVTFENVIKVMYELIESDQRVQEFVFNCNRCGGDAQIDGKALEDAQQYLSSKWQHTNCP